MPNPDPAFRQRLHNTDMHSFDPLLKENTPREECGVFGIFQRHAATTDTAQPANNRENSAEAEASEKHHNNFPNATDLTVLGLQALQHRGQEACGIVAFTGDSNMDEIPTALREVGMVTNVFPDRETTKNMPGHIAVGHTRYVTRGSKNSAHAIQPFDRLTTLGRFALAHNGQFTNTAQVRQRLIQEYRAFDIQSDTLAVVEAIAASKNPEFIARIKEGVLAMQGAFALVIATPQHLIGVRDPHGIRPLILGKIRHCGSHVLASESCALDIVDADIIRDIAPGEMVIIDKHGVRFEKLVELVSKPRTCIFEYVYFSRPDSIVDGKHVYRTRINMGRELAAQELAALGLKRDDKTIDRQAYLNRLHGDIVISVPDSGNPAAIGFAKGLGIDFEMGIIRNHYTGRSFIKPDKASRLNTVKVKHNPNLSVIEGKRVYVIDDSIIRGSTSSKIAAMLCEAGAREVHLRVSCPQIMYDCCYGIDIPNREDLLSVQHDGNLETIVQALGIDSLAYLSLEGIYRALGEEKRDDAQPQFTDHYFTGVYPVPRNPDEDASFDKTSLKMQMELGL